MIDEYITPDIFNKLKKLIMTECDRRQYVGSVKDSYGSSSGKYYDLTKDNIFYAKDYNQYKTPLQTIIGTQDSQLQAILGNGTESALKVAQDVQIKQNDLFNKENILILEALTTILSQDSETASTQVGTHCNSSCTGLCYTTCTTSCSGCRGGCRGSCKGYDSSGDGGGSTCSGDCSSGCGGKCTGFCTGNCHSTCKDSSGSCGKCSGNCDGSCMQGCSGTLK